MIDLHTLTDGGQSALDIARRLAAFLDDAQQSLELALYDVRLRGKVADVVRGALERAPGRGVQARLVYNVDHGKRVPVPPPPRTEPSLLETLPFATKAIPGVPDLMHHKYVIRDGRTVWTGSANWTDDSWTREENVIAVVDSPGLAGRFAEDFEQLWATTNVEKSGRVASDAVDGIRPWFCPGRGEQLAHRIARALGSARRRIRIASPVITSGPILGTLAELASDARLDLAGVVDATQMREVLHQWHDNGNASWKIPALRRVLERGEFTGKRSTPYRPGSVHDYMHAKVTIADDTIFLGSYNLSHSGELNAENVLELEDAALAQTLATFIDEIRALYDPVELPPE